MHKGVIIRRLHNSNFSTQVPRVLGFFITCHGLQEFSLYPEIHICIQGSESDINSLTRTMREVALHCIAYP